MIKKYLCKVLVVLIFTIYGLGLNPIEASASWKQDSNGWWNTEGSSYSIGWKEIDGKWYYFNSDGYMAHDTTINSSILGSDGAWIESTYTNTTTQGNQNSNSDSFDVNVSLKYNINLDDKVKGTNPNIIKATRQAIFDADCYCAKLEHYNGYSVNNDVLIFDVKEAGTDTWKVDFYEKKLDEKEYDTSGYSVATVEKQKDGSYTGGLTIHPPVMPVGETY